jgi:regulator of sirC expression with transglutaminase-like and TPR domain
MWALCRSHCTNGADDDREAPDSLVTFVNHAIDEEQPSAAISEGNGHKLVSGALARESTSELDEWRLSVDKKIAAIEQAQRQPRRHARRHARAATNTSDVADKLLKAVVERIDEMDRSSCAADGAEGGKAKVSHPHDRPTKKSINEGELQHGKAQQHISKKTPIQKASASSSSLERKQTQHLNSSATAATSKNRSSRIADKMPIEPGPPPTTTAPAAEEAAIQKAVTGTKVVAEKSPAVDKQQMERFSKILAKAEAEAKTGNHMVALDDFSAAIAIQKDSSMAWAGRGNSHLRLNKLQEALSDLDEALRLDSNLLGPRASRADIRLKLGNVAGCIEDLNHYLRLAPCDGRALFLRGSARQRHGDPVGAQRDFKLAKILGYNGTG